MDPIPRLALPLRLNGSGFATVEQDTLDELVVTVSCICSFPLGFRIEAPEFGIPELELTELAAARRRGRAASRGVGAARRR